MSPLSISHGASIARRIQHPVRLQRLDRRRAACGVRVFALWRRLAQPRDVSWGCRGWFRLACILREPGPGPASPASRRPPEHAPTAGRLHAHHTNARRRPMTTTLRGNWNYPTSIKFGAGRIVELPEHCRALGMRRPLLVTDAGHRVAADDRASGRSLSQGRPRLRGLLGRAAEPARGTRDRGRGGIPGRLARRCHRIRRRQRARQRESHRDDGRPGAADLGLRGSRGLVHARRRQLAWPPSSPCRRPPARAPRSVEPPSSRTCAITLRRSSSTRK